MLILVRHGRTALNAAGKFQGHLDPELDDLGIRQAQATAAALDGTRIDAVISSPLRRAQQTAAVFGLPVTIDERWIELDYGEWDGTPVGDVSAATWHAWHRDVQFAPPGGESLHELGVRVTEATTEIMQRADEANIVVVTHVSPIKAAVVWALGGDDALSWKFVLSTASITRLARRGQGAVVMSFNEAAHVPVE